MSDALAPAAGAETPAHLTNDKRFSDFMKQVTSLGNEAALGKDSLPKLAVAVVRMAADGVIELDTKDSKGNDIAAVIYERYVAAEGKKAIHEHSDGGKKGNVSKLRQLIAMGLMTTIDGVELMDNAFKARKAAVDKKQKVKSAYPFYVDVAREQQKQTEMLDADTLEELALKDGAAPKTVEGELKRALKILEGLVTGENRDKLKDADDLTEVAFHAVKDRLQKMATLALRQKLVQEAAKLGLTLA